MTDEPELNEPEDELPVEEPELVDEQPMDEESSAEPSESVEEPEVAVLVAVPQSPTSSDELAPEGTQNASLNPDDVGADSDLARPSRAMQFRVQRRMQFSNALPALLLVAAGVLLLLRPDAATRLLIIVIAISGVALSLVVRFLFNGRRERGLFFIAVMILLLTGILGATAKNWLDLGQGWPLFIIAPGAAMLLTFIFERSHDRGLLLPSLMFMVAGGTILLFTMSLLSTSVLSIVALYWPVLLLILALAVLPSAVRDRAEAPVRIAIDASRTTIAARTGTENYALQLIRALIALPSPHQFTLYFRDAPPSNLFAPLPNVQSKVIPFPRLWTHMRFAAELWKDRPDATFVPAHALPLIFPGKAVATVHDLGYRFFPQAHPTFERTYLDLTTRTTSRRATRILADSLATKRDLIAEYGVSGDKIDVIYPGVEGLHRAAPSEIAAVRAKYKLPERYFLFLGTLQPRKNIQRLIEAYGRYCAENDHQDLGLVLAGKRGWLIEEPLRSALAALPIAQRERVILTGYIQDDEVAPLYSGALALVFPSLYEGFGFPVLEAMLCGTPVLCANTSSLPELAGDATLLVDPLSVRAIAAGMAQLANDATLCESLVNKGFQQAAQFTWKRAAQLTLQALEAARR